MSAKPIKAAPAPVNSPDFLQLSNTAFTCRAASNCFGYLQVIFEAIEKSGEAGFDPDYVGRLADLGHYLASDFENTYDGLNEELSAAAELLKGGVR